jgi:Holliday junction resolvase RusA-like endonuclease
VICINAIEFNLQQVPWSRPMYTIDRPDLLIPSLKADFEDRIHNEFIAEMIRCNKVNKFPLQEEAGLLVLVHSKKPHILLYTIKNILDSLKNLAYKDDLYVSSIYAILINEESELVDIYITTTPHINTWNTIKGLRKNALLTVNVAGNITDKILYTPRDPTINIYENPINTKQQLRISEVLHEAYPCTKLLGDIFLKLEIYTSSKHSDIDNIAINYMIPVSCLLLSSPYQVKALLINLYRNKSDKAYMELSSVAINQLLDN